MANMAHSTGYEPNQPDKMVPADDDATPINDPDYDSISDISKTTHENTGWFGVFLQCVKPLFRRLLEVTLLFRKKAKKASLG